MENKKLTIQDVLSTIKEKGYQLDFTFDIPDEMKSNPEVISCILKHEAVGFDELPDAAKNDREILKQIAAENSSDFENFPDWAKDDEEIATIAVENSYNSFENASLRLRSDRALVIKAFTSQCSSDTINHVGTEELKNDIEILKLAVRGHEQAFGNIPEKWRSNKELIDIVLTGKVNSSSFEHFPAEYKDNREIAIKVLNDDGGCFQYLSERLRDDKELAILSVKKDTWSSLRSVSERLKNDIEVVLAYVLEDNRTLSDFPDEFKDNEKVIEACLKGGGTAYEYFSERFKNDRNITLQMSAKWNFDLGAAPEIFKTDREIVKNAIKEDADNFEYVGSELLKDFTFLKELFMLNDRVLSNMDENLKAQLFTTKVQSIEHYGKKIVYEMVIEDGYVQNNQRSIKNGLVQQGDIELVRCSSFPVLTYEDDGPVGSYLSVRYLNNFLLAGNFTFFVKENTGKETWTNCLSKDRHYQGYGPEPETNDDFLKHEVYLITEPTKTIEYNNLTKFPRLLFGRQKNLPKGIQLFLTEESYREALTVLKQEKIYGEPQYKKLNNNSLEAFPRDVDEIFGAARVYVDGFGWRFLIPNKEGALTALEVLKATSDKDDLDWIKTQSGILTDYQKNLLKEHFVDLY